MTPIYPYCDKPAELATGAQVYPHRRELSELRIWRCRPCNAQVGCHKRGAYIFVEGRKLVSGGTLPLGALANARLRASRQRAHAAFDPIWKSQRMSRTEAYAWLVTELGIPGASCHIGMMDEETCESVIELCGYGAVPEA